MKSLSIFYLLILWAPFYLNAQTCPGAPLTLSTQAQVNNFPTNYPGCTEVGVSITVSGNNITNLNGLSQIESITKSLFLINNSSLTSLTGLSNLSNIGVELTIDNCDALTTLNGLQSLPFIGGTLTITGNAQLNDLSALNGIGYVNGSINITQNPALTSLAGLDNVTFCGRFLQITNNNALTALNSLDNMIEVGNNVNTNGRYLSIGSNPNLTTLNGLHSLVSVGTDFEIANNGNLVTLDAFTNLSTIGGEFAITGNPDLTSVLDFASLSSIGGTLTISNNNVLGDCEAQGICDILEAGGAAIISNNDPGCNSVAQVEAACLLLPVQLTYFHGKPEADGILLHWQTASETNNRYFDVEHSANGKNFRSLGAVKGAGTTSTPANYEFRHMRPATGTNYYRLKQVDFDGNFGYSNIVNVDIAGGDETSIFPNPTTDGIVFVKGNLSGYTAIVTDITGRNIVKQDLFTNNMIDLKSEPKGVYLIEIQSVSETTVRRVIKK